MLERIPLPVALGLLAACNPLMTSRPSIGLCGDSIVQEESKEQCDDGNTTAGDGCSATCQVEACGNGVQDEGEECDLGPANDDSGDCTRQCTLARCGDGQVKSRGAPPHEVCDDGNDKNGDGCNPTCTLRGRVTIFRGTPGGQGISDGVGPAARLSEVRGVASDAKYLYLSDGSGCSIRRMEIAKGMVETIAGSGTCNAAILDGEGRKAVLSPSGKPLALVGSSLYFAEDQSLRRVDLSFDRFMVETLGFFPELRGHITALAADPSDSTALYLSDWFSIYQIALPCTWEQFAEDKCAFHLLAGSGFAGISDGLGPAASFVRIADSGLAVDSSRNVLYVADVNRIRQLDLTSRRVQTVAGSGHEIGHFDGIGNQARFFSLQGLAHRGNSLYALEISLDIEGLEDLTNAWVGWGNVREIDTETWQVKTIAGSHGSFGPGSTSETDGFGPFARFLYPRAAALWGDVLFVSEDASIRSLSLATGHVVTVAGKLIEDFTYFDVQAVASREGLLYVATHAGDFLELPLLQNAPVRRLALCQNTWGGRVLGHSVDGIAVWGSEIYVLDAELMGICRVDLAGKKGKPCCAGCKETCEAVFVAPGGEPQDNEYYRWNPRALATDGQYLYFIVSGDQRLLRVDPTNGEYQALSFPWKLSSPFRMVYAKKALYATVPYENMVLRIDPESGAWRAFGNGLPRTADGKGAQISFCQPFGITTDGEHLFVGEGHCPIYQGAFHGHAVRQIDLETDEVTTLTGPGPMPYVVEGAGGSASVNWPAEMAFDSTTGAIYIGDRWDNVLLRVD